MASTNDTAGDEIKSASDIYRPRKFGQRQRQAFYRDRTRRWTAHAGGTASDSLALLIHQACSLEWDILRLEQREMERGRLSAHDRVALAAWRRHFREIVRQLGPRAVERRVTIGELAAAYEADQARARRRRRPAAVAA